VHLERDVREEVTLVEAVPVDLEDAADMRLVVRVVVEFLPADLDGAVVPRRVGARLPGPPMTAARTTPMTAASAAPSATRPPLVRRSGDKRSIAPPPVPDG
jgi:hypothetical protein